MLAGLNSNWWLTSAALAASALALRAGLADRSSARTGSADHRMPAFWYAATLILGVMAVAHAGDLGGLIADVGRRGSQSEGWYGSRRLIQGLAVGGVAATTAVLGFFTMLRFPERRRRYLPMSLVLLGLICFDAIRLVSLHQIDTALYRTTVAGAEVGVLLELAGLAVASAMTFWQPRRSTVQTPLR